MSHRSALRNGPALCRKEIDNSKQSETDEEEALHMSNSDRHVEKRKGNQTETDKRSEEKRKEEVCRRRAARRTGNGGQRPSLFDPAPVEPTPVETLASLIFLPKKTAP